MRLLTFTLGLAMAAGLAAPSHAQEQTLADIRQEVSALSVSIQQLRREMSTTGGASVAIGGDTLQRVDLIEAALSRLTSKTEELEFRINQIVQDGTNRIGDLEFRLCELEAGCDLGALGNTTTLGGGTAPMAPLPQMIPPTQTQPDQSQLAMGEQSDFDRAKAALDSGDFRSAADLFETFTATYPGGPLSSQSQYYRGQALAGMGETSRAARAYLQSFSGSPDGPLAPDALVGLGSSLGLLGQVAEACTTLAEVAVRFPGSGLVSVAEQERRQLACP